MVLCPDATKDVPEGHISDSRTKPRQAKPRWTEPRRTEPRRTEPRTDNTAIGQNREWEKWKTELSRSGAGLH